MLLSDSSIPQKLASLENPNSDEKSNCHKKGRDDITAKALKTINEHAFQFINSSIASAIQKNDGKQTPMENHPVFIARHETATCCRGCISKWHRMEKGRARNGEEVDFIAALIMGWIEGQID